ncbi:phage major capsid protein, P2 family [Escherichia coli]|nr:phage major capsid protein, P2 family [Escherichia coli]MDF9000309.1 phage major capsid protein, P2 family [Escherichia coli]MDF9025442.1 phage major capsid protein, P2 family [Escherichia coli]HCK1608928.1 phage major capsid protein, P2 family [Escherichia coli]
MNLTLSSTTRGALAMYMQQQAGMNNVSPAALAQRFNVQPAVQQRMENAIQLSDELLQRINVIGVTDQKGEKVLIGINGPSAGVNTSTSERREPASLHELTARQYACEQINYDTFISYAQLDAWSAHPDFQERVSAQIARRVALDRIMIGFNGTSRAVKSDRSSNPLLQDCAVGWLESIRQNAAQRVMSDVTITARDMDNTVTYKGKYNNPDALVQDARSSLLDEWYKDSSDLVVMMGRDLFNTLRLPLINAMSAAAPNTELMAGQLITSSRLIGGLPVYLAPFFPADALLITSFDNLSVYYQVGALRRLMREEPDYNRIATYQSSNDAWVVEDFGKCALITGLKLADESNHED